MLTSSKGTLASGARVSGTKPAATAAADVGRVATELSDLNKTGMYSVDFSGSCKGWSVVYNHPIGSIDVSLSLKMFDFPGYGCCEEEVFFIQKVYIICPFIKKKSCMYTIPCIRYLIYSIFNILYVYIKASTHNPSPFSRSSSGLDWIWCAGGTNTGHRPRSNSYSDVSEILAPKTVHF